MQRYNIAFLPVDPAVQAVLSEISIRNFEEIHDEYILGKQALAHVTVCHFRCEKESEAVEAHNSFSGRMGIKLRIERFQIRPGTQINPGKYIAEMVMELTEELCEYRRAVISHLAARGIAALAAGDAYSPHMTLARLTSKPVIAPDIKAPFAGPITYRPALGIGTESGVFLREIKE